MNKFISKLGQSAQGHHNAKVQSLLSVNHSRS